MASKATERKLLGDDFTEMRMSDDDTYIPATKEYLILRKHFRILHSTIDDTVSLAVDLFTVLVISERVMGAANSDKISVETKKFELLRGLMNSIVRDPANLRKFLDVLKNRPSLHFIHERMKKDYDSPDFSYQAQDTHLQSGATELRTGIGPYHRAITMGVRGKFDGLVLCFQKAVESVNVKIQDLKNFIIYSCPFNSCKEELRGAKDISELFNIVRTKLCSLVNYEILVSIADHFKLTDALTAIQEYEIEEQNYRKKLVSAAFAEELKKETESMIHHHSATKSFIVLRLKWGSVDRFTVTEFGSIVDEVFSELSRYIHLIKVDPGSIIVTMCAPEQVIGALIVMAKRKTSYLQEIGVTFLSIGDKVILKETELKVEPWNQRSLESDETSILKTPVDHDQAMRVAKLSYSEKSGSLYRDAVNKPCIKGKPEDKVTVTFHALLPTTLWEYDDSSSEVYIRFGGNKLGNWNCDHGPMQVEPRDGEQVEVTLTLPINYDVFHAYGHGMVGVPYKYCVYTPRTIKKPENTQYEYIHGTEHIGISSELANRFLKVPLILRGCTYQQFDTIILPSFCIKPPNELQIRKTCLEIYLAKQFTEIKFGNIINPRMKLATIVQIFNCLCSPFIIYNRGIKNWMCHSLKQNLKTFLVSELTTGGNIPGPGSKLIVATMIICCLQSLHIEVEKDEAVSVFPFLALNPDVKKRDCPDLATLQDILSENQLMRQQLLSRIRQYFNLIIHPSKLQQSFQALIKTIVFQHLINEECKPFGIPERNPKLIKWFQYNTSIPQDQVRKITQRASPELFANIYSLEESSFCIDPLLLPLFIYWCPINKCKHLFEVVPPFYSTARLAYLYCTTSAVLSLEDAKLVSELLRIIDRHVDKLSLAENSSKREAKQLFHSIFYLSVALQGKSDILQNPYIDVFLLYMSLFLKALNMTLSDESEATFQGLRAEAFSHQTKIIKTWINNVIGGKMFGCDVTRYNSWLFASVKLLREKEEFHAWEYVLSIKCPETLTQPWHRIISRIVNERLSKVPQNLKVDLITYAERKGRVSPLILGAIIEDASNSVEELISGGEATESFRKLQDSKYMTQLLGNIVNKKFHGKKLTIEDVLEWKLWPMIIKIFIQHQVFNEEDLSENGQKICREAVEVFNSVCMSVLDGSITINVLEKLQKREDHVNKLCEAITVQEQPCFSLEEISSSLDIRFKEYKLFVRHREELSTFHRHLNVLNIPDLEYLSSELHSAEIKLQSISSICSLKEDQIVYHCFQYAKPLFPILSKFTLLTKTHQSTTFQKFWDDQVKLVQEKTLNFDEVVEQIWKPAFKRSCDYLKSLQYRTMKLVEVNQLLDKKSDERLEIELKVLDEGICKCEGITSDFSWIKPCIQRMQEYRSLRQHAIAAKAFLKLKDTLRLTGDFRIVEGLAAEFEESVQDQSLQFIDDSLVKTGEFLHGISSDKNKLKCLQVFADCQELVEWIRNETEDVHDLHHFVIIALATAAGGEDDYTRDRLSLLCTVGSGFATLIYRLPQDTGYRELQTHCMSLWESLKHDRRLPEKMVTCSQQIEWYKSVKETQGSVEKSSFGQMNNITEYGCYTVGSRTEGVRSKPSELIRMDLEQRDKALPQLKYSMDELRDLESKLVLITGRESEEKANVDHFLKVFNTVCHIAELLIQLQQHSHDKYMGWVLRFPCRLHGIVEKLTEIRRSMIDDLDQWQQMVAEARQHYYSLNYYTTQQLLLLRKELGHFTDPEYDGNMKPDVITLLQCLSREITPELIISQMRGDTHDDEYEDDEEEIESIPDSKDASQMDITPTAVQGNIASEIIKLSSSSVPQPLLEEKDYLSDRQKAIMDNLITCYGFHEKLILLAFDRCAKPDIEEDVEKWCDEHEEDFVFSDDSESRQSEESDRDDKELSLEERSVETVSMESQSSSPVVQQHKKKPLVASIRVEERIPINEDHPVVKQLLLAGYSLEQCQEAAERYPKNVQKAMDYIDSLEENDDQEMEELFLSRMPDWNELLSNGSYTGVTDIEIVCDSSAKGLVTFH